MAQDDNEYIDLDAEAEAEKSKKSGKKEGEKSGTGRGRQAPHVSEAAQALMKERGLSLAQIKEILSSWRHLDAKEVVVRLAEFGKDVAKASAHIMVSFSNKGYGVMTHFLKQCQRLAGVARKLTASNRQKVQQKHDVNLG